MNFISSHVPIFSFGGNVQVIRGGRRVEVSIYDLVVGDVVPLNIGDQVCAFVSKCFMYISQLHSN